jgi:hypothetical protein
LHMMNRKIHRQNYILISHILVHSSSVH